MIALLLLVLADPSPGKVVLYVDLQAVIENLPETEAIKKTVDSERIRRSAILDRDLREATAAERKDSAFLDRIEAQRLEHEKQLERLEARLLVPLLEKVRAMLPPDVYSLDQAPIVDPKPICGRTAWLKKKAFKQDTPFVPAAEACRFLAIYELDFDQAMAKSELGRRTAKMLDQIRDDRQRELDKERLKGTSEAALAEQHRAEQAALVERENKAKAELEAKIFEKLEALKGPTVLFLEKPVEGKGVLAACDITDWVARALDGAVAAPACP